MQQTIYQNLSVLGLFAICKTLECKIMYLMDYKSIPSDCISKNYFKVESKLEPDTKEIIYQKLLPIELLADFQS